MAERHILKGDPPIEVELRKSARARRMTLRVAALDGRVTLTVPRGVTQKAALDFVNEKRAWIGQHKAKVVRAVGIAIGGAIPVEGREVTLELGAVRAPRLAGDALLVPKRAAEAPGRAVRAFLKLLARERLAAASDHYAAELGRAYTSMTLRDTRSRWGSCSSKGSLNYSWRLAMAPPQVLKYVAAHEVAHLAEMNHSPAFWAHVAKLMPDYEAPRRWLREHGTSLQRIVLD
ncbi:MAG: SprT family zinc-dependent metalloprotease [Pseudomonadota bacterium]